MVTHNRQPQTADPLLAELARLYGVQTAYRDYRGRGRESPVESIVLVLRALGAELGDIDAGDDPLRGVTPARLEVAIRERKRELWSRVLEPVIVAWEGRLPPVAIRLRTNKRPRADSRRVGGGLRVSLVLDGSADEYVATVQVPSQVSATETIGGSQFDLYCLPSVAEELQPLPLGLHRLRVGIAGSETESTVIAAPRHCWSPPLRTRDRVKDTGSSRFEESDGAIQAPAESWSAELPGLMAGRAGKLWGLFAPLYAVRTHRNWGVGDLADLDTLLGFVTDRGGHFVSTLPLLAAFLDQPFEPGPYRPISRLLWNELYLAVDRIPEWRDCEPARDLWLSADARARVRRLRAEPKVAYREVMALKRAVLERLARCFFEKEDPERTKAFADFVQAHPLVQDYAAFRARSEVLGPDWREWPRPSASEHKRAPLEGDSARYHLFCQWQMEEQLARLAESGERQVSSMSGTDEAPGGGSYRGAVFDGSCRRLLLDLPVGVHPQGYDTWRWSELFARGMSTGAPPDDFFPNGQDWSVTPLHPQRIREHGHFYFAECLRNHMRHSCCLRIDHVMALHRLFWVPEGTAAADGVYVAYPTDELYAILCLESQRHQVIVAGEDLGTVPGGVRSAMREHSLLRTWVLQASLRPRATSPVPGVPKRSVASLSTHDMFPFAGYLQGEDIVSRVERGHLDNGHARRDLAARARLVERLRKFLGVSESGEKGLLRAVLSWLASSPSEMVTIDLEDLLLETRPQNLPGTTWENGNWQRKVGVNLESIFTDCAIAGRNDCISRRIEE